MANHSHILLLFSEYEPDKIHGIIGPTHSMTKQELADAFNLARITGLKSTSYQTSGQTKFRYYFVPTVDGKFIGF